jgi:Bacterial protein of unknown function (DUF899)
LHTRDVASAEGRRGLYRRAAALAAKVSRKKNGAGETWVRVEKDVFDSPSGKKTLADIFDGKSEILIYDFMLGPDCKEDARAAPSIWIIRTVPWCIWLKTTPLLRRFPSTLVQN